MKKNEYAVEMVLTFGGLTLDEIKTLEEYVREGLDGKQWGDILGIKIHTLSTGERETKKTKRVSKEELLEAEKSKGVSCS